MTRRACCRTLPFLLVAFALTASVARGQSTTGTPPFGSFGGGPDVINLASLNAHWAVPVFSRPGRGVSFSYTLAYDSLVWSLGSVNGSSAWLPATNWGWAGQTQVATGYLSYTTRSVRCVVSDPLVYPKQYAYGNTYTWTYVDAFGTSHSHVGNTSDGTCYSQSGGGTAWDGSGWSLSAWDTVQATITSRSGTVMNPPIMTTSGTASYADANGNQITTNGTTFTDTLGTTALTVGGSGTPANPTTYTYTAPSGAAIVQVSFKAYTVQTNFGCSGVTEYPATNVNLIDKITLPDSSFYQFAYEQTYGSTTNYTGRLAKVTLPTGGSIRYQYPTYTDPSNVVHNGGINCADGTATAYTRTTLDGTWTYSRALGTAPASITTITAPQLPYDSAPNQTVIQFQGIYETQRQVYQGSSTSGPPLSTTYTCYNATATPCNSTAVTLPITQRDVTVQLPNNLQSKITTLFNSSYGMPTEKDEYDYGSGAPPTSPLRKTLVTYASLSNGIFDHPATITVCTATGTSGSCNGTGTQIAQTKYNYDETAVTATSGAPQHVSVSGSRGNLTSINYPVTGLTAHFSYYDTGTMNTSTDVNGAVTTFNYSSSSCGNSFPTSVSEPLSMSRSMTWNCNGAVKLTATDENSQTVRTTYNDPYFWRPNVATDQLGNQTSITYQPNSYYMLPFAVASTLTFNNGSSVVEDVQYKDGLGRTYVEQLAETPSPSLLDSVSYTFDSNGRPYSVSTPCAIGYAGTCSTPKTTQTYDALNRPLQTTDGGGGTVTYYYFNNDALVTVGPAPSGENTKRRQLEYDSLGRLTSVCEISSLPGSGTCGQTQSQTGYWTKYTYDALGNLLNVTQNAQASPGSQQTRNFSYDAMSRLTSETNPESGTTNYAYDSVSGTVCAPTSPGNLIKRSDANGNYTCFNYDLLHRLTDIGNNNASATNPGRRFRYDNSPGYAGSTKPAGLTNTMGRLIEAATDVGQPSNDAILTDEWFSYTARGEVSDVYQSMPHSGGYYHLTQSYWGNGATNQLNGLPGLPTLTYGVDGEGRVSTLSASSGQNPVTGVTYNAGSLPTQVNFGSGDSDIFAYDANTLRQTQYQFNINGQSDTGTLTWNANSTLSQLTISDAFNSADTQTCNYAHDDLSRIAQADCGSGGWGQSFTYDPFGNISKNVLASHTGNSFQPTYNSATNRFWSIPGATVSYDANGNVLTDGSHTYAWDADGNSISLDGVGLTFDALDRMVEQNNSGTYTEIVYSPGGAKLALMSGQTLQKAFIPLPGRATAVYTSSGLDHYRHSDWLGSVRLTSSPTRAVLSTAAYASFGETYAQSGTADLSFTGQNADTVSGDYDFLYRECSNQGRWASPDAAGLAAVDSSNPQSWNRYAYVLNNPMVFVDPSGLAACHFEMVDAILQTYMRVLSENGDPVINPEWNLVDEQRGQVGILACSSGPERLGGGGGGGGGGGIGTALAKINQIKTLCDKARSSGGGQIPFDGGVVSFDSSGGLMAGSVDLGHGMGFASAQLAGRDSVGRPSVIFSFSKPYNVGGATIDSVLFSGSEPSPMGRGQVGAFTAATGTVGRLGGSLAELLILHNLNGSQQARGAANLIGSLFGSPCEGILADLALVGRF